MSTQVDFTKSILKEKLIFKRDLYGYLDIFFENIIALILLLVIILFLSNRHNFVGKGAIYFNVILILLALWLILGIYFMKKLVKIQGLNPESNRKKIVDLLSREFPKENFNTSGEHIIVSKKSTGLFSWGKIITVLF